MSDKAEVVNMKPGKMEADAMDDVEESPVEDNLMWVEKYRPSTLDEIISHKNILESVTKLTDANKLPHLLLYGPPGTGKTTMALAIARKLNGPKYQAMTLELNASDERGIDVVRHTVKSFAETQQIFSSGHKFVILDEADAMTGAAQFALRRVIEKYTSTTRFCLICNYVNKIIPALQSRCTKFRFEPLDVKHIRSRLQMVAEKEGVKTTASGLKTIMKLSGGDMRKCLNVLQACHVGYDETNETNVHLCTGTPMDRDIEQILNVLLNENYRSAYESISGMQTEQGIALGDIIARLHDLFLRLQLPPKVRIFVLKELADLDYRIANACNDSVQLGSLVGIFQLAREKTLESNRKNKG